MKLFRSEKTEDDKLAEQMADGRAKAQKLTEKATARAEKMAKKAAIKDATERAAAKARRHEAMDAVFGSKVTDGSLSPDRFEVSVTENLTGSGGRLGGYGQRNAAFQTMAAYRVVVTDMETGVPQKIGYAPTYKSAHRTGRLWIDQIVTGKRRLKG
ncbi:hypothetical protein FBY35_0156 [Streptomyces sp. SLBN-118]|uniref:hypothetical protein n=1 Tax=Streptomyces sp. SLBN-118 TaxID=2768454 RepID=UPI00114E43E5|nr:hypothetical protein [Streptomyces sp. SLBN-118]TQK49880.1 hypothetical protein FBY35_0156 [Streptomyces sp. SLBN-118]